MKTTAPKKRDLKRLATKHDLREVWLRESMTFIREHFIDAGYTIPDNVRIGVGWPSRGAFGKQRTIGQAWSNSCSADGTHEIIISVYLDDPIKVIGVLIHECIHVTVGVGKGHRKPFVDCMKQVGLDGKPTATGETPELVEKIKVWLKTIGKYPHARLDGSERKKQSTRLIGLTCESCGCKVRVSNKWIETYQMWPCPCGSGKLKEND